MFSIYNSSDISQLIIKRQMRNNQSILFLIKGTDNVVETSDILKAYSSKCTEIFYNRSIEKPTYDEVQTLNMCLSFIKSMKIEDIYKDINCVFGNLDKDSKDILFESIGQVFSECLNNKLSSSMIKNGYIRCLNTLNNRLSKVTYTLSNDNRILFVGKPDKYDILAFTALGLCGVDVVICDFDAGVTSECMCVNRFVCITGQNTNVDLKFLNYINQGISDVNKGIAVANEWVNFKDYKNIEDGLKLLSFNLTDRFEKDKWKVIHLEYQGVDNDITYSNILDNFMINLKASNRPFMLFNKSILKPTYEEVERFKALKIQSVFDIFNSFPVLKNTGVVVKYDEILNRILVKSNFVDDRKKNNYKDSLIMWTLRVIDKFYNVSNLNMMPLIVSFNITNEKEKDFIELLSCLPLDIVVFNPSYQVAYHSETNISDMKIFVIGEKNVKIVQYPENTGVEKVATTAYNAERELDNLLYTDTSLFRIKQFKEINPIVLKTTYEEVDILWNEPAKFRPSFESVGNLVTVPTIFTKINGVNENYKSDLKKKLGENTLFFDSFPIQLQPSVMDNGKNLRDFTKQLIFKDSIDFEKLKNSKYYTFGVYSEETQNLIFEKVSKLISMNWCVSQNKNLPYEILDTVFRIPLNIMQMIHNYDFTGGIPKIIIYNGTNIPCSLSDCILIMFLKLVGFDVIIYAPTGYRVVEQYISNQLFNEITIGQFNFNLEHIDFNVVSSNTAKKQGFFSRLFE